MVTGTLQKYIRKESRGCHDIQHNDTLPSVTEVTTFCTATLRIMIRVIMPLTIMPLNIMTLTVKALIIMTLAIMTHAVMTLAIMTLNIIALPE